MNKRTLSLVIAVAFCGYSGLLAVTGKIMSEMSLQRGVIHYPLEECDPEKPWQVDVWGAGYCRKAWLSLQRGVIHYPLEGCDTERSWHVDVWGAGYCRKACQAFMCDDCNANGSTTETTDLSKLFFGKSSFHGQEAFANGVLTVPTGFPGLVFAKISPQFSYSEAGVFLGIHAQKDICDSCWAIGCRASLPISRVEVQQRGSCNCESWDEDSCNLAVCRQEFTNANPNTEVCPGDYLGDGHNMNNVCAYRLDFLNTLLMPDGTPMVKYGDGTSNTTVADIPITLYTERGLIPPDHSIAPMYVLGAVDGNLANAITIGTPQSVLETNNLGRDVGPDTPSDPAEVAQWVLNAAGTNHNPEIIVNGDRLAFSQTINYESGIGANTAQQSQWFLVPNSTGGAIDGVLVDAANAVQNAIEYVLQGQENCPGTAINFFKQHCVDFTESECVVGAGDLYAEWYAGYHPECWYIDMLLGSKLPTGKKMCDAKRIYWQPTGNNGHFELRGGVEGGLKYSWFALRGMLSYSHAFNHTEMRAPAFEGATIKNIPAGESVPTRVNWGYFWGNLDITLFHPKCSDCGLVFGYELYAKQNDKVCFCNSTAKDFLGFTHKLDNTILERGTNTNLHKIRGGVFYRIGCCECFGDAYYSIAGHCAMKETEFHVGAAIYF